MRTVMWLLCTVIVLSAWKGGSQIIGNNYGPYTVTWEKMEICKGPKPTDCGNIEIGNIQNASNVIFRLDLPQNCLITGGKISASTLQNNKTKNKLWNYVLNKPCQHFVLGPLLTDLLNVTHDCKVKKGLHEIHINIREQTRKFLGNNFFYGTYIFKSMTHNKNANFFCVDTVINVKRIS
ncbi:uncharacterized protein LOC115445042 [Manduca sexta]|uniref:uncharacterized protein LOC115445042 n=1 Tax=Manduca sexta TaxID=7130 RepID=UPI0011844F06|nr:uncharacterized protein LOC115445042 [Manduca sexta]